MMGAFDAHDVTCRFLQQRDAALPGLEFALDERRARDLLACVWPNWTGGALRTEYLRYKPGRSCVAGFAVDVPGGPPWIHVTAYRREAREKLDCGAVRPTEDAQSGPIVVPQYALVVWPFPYDKRLAGLPRWTVSGPQGLWTRLSGTPESSPAAWQTLRYKPQRRFVAQASTADGRALVVRLYAADGYRRAWRAAKSLGGLAAGAAYRPVGHSARHGALAFSWIDGVPLATAGALCAELAHWHAAGRAAGSFHGLAAGKLPCRTSEGESRRLVQLAHDLSALEPDLGGAALDVARRCGQGLLAESGDVATLHGDLHPGQFVVRTAATLIDWDAAAVGEAALDLGNLHARLEYSVALGHVRPAQAEQIWEAFVEGYQEVARLPAASRLALGTAAGWLSLAHDPFRRRAADWPAQTAAVLDAARTWLEEAGGSAAVRPRPAPPGAESADLAALASDRLLAASAALQPAAVEQTIGPLLVPADAGSWRLLQTDVLRHKPGRRCVVRYRFRHATTGVETSVLGKIHAKSRHEQSFTQQTMLWHAGFDADSADGVSVAEPVGLVPAWKMWLQRRVAGCDGWQPLATAYGDQAVDRVAWAMVKLQRTELPLERRHDVDQELEILERRLAELADARRDLAPRIRRLTDACRRLAERFPTKRFVPTHRDFYPDQLVFSGSRLFVLDHDLLCLADPHVDVGNFAGHLVEAAVRQGGAARWALPRAARLVDRFLDWTPYANRRAAEAYVALTVARLVAISHAIPARRRATDALLADCERRVAALHRA